MSSNKEQVGKALDILCNALYPYVERQMRAVYGNNWLSQAKNWVSAKNGLKQNIEDALQDDIAALLTVMSRRWEKVFKQRKELSHTERALVSELIEVRNQWAHGRFSNEDTYRALDSITRLLEAIGATEAQEVEKYKQVALKSIFQEQSKPSQRSQTPKEKQLRQAFQELLNAIPFNNVELLDLALTRTSYLYENPKLAQGDNEQLEFLGDSVLNFLAGDYLYNQSLDYSEQELTEYRSLMVRNSQLAKFARQLNLIQWVKRGKGEKQDNNDESLLSNVFEALIGAYYLDSGVEAVKEFLEPFFESVQQTAENLSILSNAVSQGNGGKDYKNILQTWAAKKHQAQPKYISLQESGEAHAKEFKFEVTVNNKNYGKGTGKNKKEAQKQAAYDACKRLQLI